MTDTSFKNGRVKIVIKAKQPISDRIPKYLQVLDSNLRIIDSVWITTNEHEFHVKPGLYAIKLYFTSGKSLEEIIDVEIDTAKTIHFKLDQLSPQEEQEWVYLTKSNLGTAIPRKGFRGLAKGLKKSSIEGVSARIWSFSDNTWKIELPAVMENTVIDCVGESLTFDVPRLLQMLEVLNPGKPSTFVMLPSGQTIHCTIRVAPKPERVLSELDVVVGTSNDIAQALLALIRSGDIKNASALFQATQAEEMLFDKQRNPVNATIGAYYLLKIGELERLHNWTNNLANWFKWLPDGSIICAWQMIQQNEKLDSAKVDFIRNHMVDSVKRGIPLFSEGLRLLYDGLNMLSNEFNQKDDGVEQALNRIKGYMNTADLSRETTSFIGSYPDQPGFGKTDPAQLFTRQVGIIP